MQAALREKIMQNISNLDTVRFDDKKQAIVIIDQTKLPGELEMLELREQADIIDAIYHLKVRGAPAIGVAAAYGAYLAAIDCENFDEAADALIAARPTAVNLSWAVEQMRSVVKENKTLPKSELAAKLKIKADGIYQAEIDASRAIGEYALTLLKDGCGILTHCNAGQLATVRYGTALAPLHIGKERGMNFRVFTDETRPLLQGARLSAFELCADAIDTTVICDNMAASVMSKGWVDAVLVGADRIAANGDCCNKVGTMGVAIMAKHFGIPFYVLAPTSTVDMSISSGEEIVIEQRRAEEVTDMWYEKKMAPEGVKVYNPAFDVTPAELVSAIITERGIINAPYKDSLREMMKEAD